MNQTKHELDNLTVFLISTDEETYEKSKKSLLNQNSIFKIKEIKNIFPMSAAFQYMPDNCETDYFIQLDADMILHHNSIYKLYTEILNSSFLTYRISGKLYEEGFGIGGHIKCWKKSIFKNFSFKNSRTVDRNFHNRVKWFGFRNKLLNEILGNHVPRHSVLSEFLKTKSDIEKWKYLRRDADKYGIPLLIKVVNENSIPKFFGLLMSCLSPWNRIIISKDINYEKKIFDFIEPYISKGSLNNFNLSQLNLDHIKMIFFKLYSNKINNYQYKNDLIGFIEIITNCKIDKFNFLIKFDGIK